MKKLTGTFLILACFLALAAGGWMYNACAAPGTKTASPAVAKLNAASAAVTDEQKARLRDIEKKYQAAVMPLMKQYVVEKSKLEQMMNAENMDEAAIRAQFTKASGVGADLVVLRARRTHDFRAVLTPDQMKKFRQMESENSGVSIDKMLLRQAYPEKEK